MIQIDYDLKNIIISALRYALGRKSYVTFEVCEYIIKHPKLIDKRVKDVMLKDLENLDEYYKKDDLDRIAFNVLKKWLEKLEVRNG